MNKTENVVEKEVFDALAVIKKVHNPPVSTLLKEGLGIDSIQLVRIITRLTARLKINIFEMSDQDLAGLRTVGDLIKLLDR